MREKYESLALVQLKELAKVRGLKGTSTMKKADLVEAMLAEDERLKKLRQRKRNRRLLRAKRQRSRREQNALSDRRGITDRTDMIDRIEMTETIGQTVPSVRIVQNALIVPKPVQRWSA